MSPGHSASDPASYQYAPWEAEGDGSNTWISATHVGDQMEFQVPGFTLVSALAVAGIFWE